MKAARLYEPGDIRIEEVKKPEISENEVLVKVKAVGICGSDIPRANEYGAHISPLTLGHEFSGEIVKLGDQIDEWEQGEKVTVGPLIPCYECEWCNKGRYSLCNNYSYFGSRRDGAMAEFVSVPENNLVKVPDAVTYEAAALTDPAANAVHGLWKGDLKEGDNVIILGLGAIGLFAVQYAKYLGADKIIAVDIFDKKLGVAKEIGATHIVNNKVEDATKKINSITNNRKADFVIETAGSKITQKQSLHLTAPDGNIVFLGISHDKLVIDEQGVENLLRGEINIVGSWNSFSDPFPGKEWRESIKLFKTGDFKYKEIISHQLKLEKVPEMFEKLKNENFYYNKIMFYPEK